ncbi:hypothetical protein CRYUN_Cryun09bG0058700 [Craigia yunnanensis]
MAWRAKVLRTLIGIGGAMLLTFYKGVQINMGSTHLDLLPYGSHEAASSHPGSARHQLSSFLALIESHPRLNIQLENYLVFRFVAKFGDYALLLQGILASGLMFSSISWCVRMRGLLYASVFNPLMLIFVAFAGSLFLEEKLYVGW